jgi:hypothetical protein
MRKFSFLLSIAGHALLLLIAIGAEFRVTVIPRPPRVIAVAIAEPLPPLPAMPRGNARRNDGARASPPGGGETGGMAATPASGGASSPAAGKGLPLFAPGRMTLRHGPGGGFNLALNTGTPWPALGPIGPPGSRPRLGAAALARFPGSPGGGTAAFGGGAVLIGFASGEKAIAAWTDIVLARIERNWTIPDAAHFSYSGQVRVTLTVGKGGGRRALVLDDSTLPGTLTQAALHAVEASLPLPPLPDNVAGSSFAFTLVFSYNG